MQDDGAIKRYLREVFRLRQSGEATEHSYRAALLDLLKTALEGATVINEPKRRECGAPDIAVYRGGVPAAFAETKNIGASLDDAAQSEQLRRYRDDLDALCLSDYLQFRFYRGGKECGRVILADDASRKPAPGEWPRFFALLKEFAAGGGADIRNPDDLAAQMARGARLLRESIRAALQADLDADAESPIRGQFVAFQKTLIADLAPPQFADIYAQTVAYGLFSARWAQAQGGAGTEAFSRETAAYLLPESNPLLRDLFSQIAGVNLDKRYSWEVESLARVYARADLAAVMEGFGKKFGREDPLMYFYEDFLRAYDPKIRVARGVFYTPWPVVDFIVRAVDDLLRDKFNLADGLADDSQITITPENGKPKKIPRAQILDPAAGTGAFLARALDLTRERRFNQAKAAWANFAVNNFLPRLNGFECMMGAYAMCHLHLEIKLRMGEAGVKDRLRVFLTNSLEEPPKHPQRLAFMPALEEEGRQASVVKRETPVMVVFGNPPYSVSSQNRNEWISRLLDDYKTGLDEKKLNLDDDYIKFIRLAQHYIEKTGEGIVGYITNNSYLSGVTHRRMRRCLLEAFDEIYILNLHGNAIIKETAPDGGKDENIFPIRPGVAIVLMIKRRGAKGTARVYYRDCYGLAADKLAFLAESDLRVFKNNKIAPIDPKWFFVPKDFSAQSEYDQGFKLNELFAIKGPGAKSERDKIAIHFSRESLDKTIEVFRAKAPEEIRAALALPPDSRDWKIARAKADLVENQDEDCFRKILYRPFDSRHTFYSGQGKGFWGTPGFPKMYHLLCDQNLALLTSRLLPENHEFDRVFITDKIVDTHAASDQTYVFPLYLYDSKVGKKKKPNFEDAAIAKIAAAIGLRFEEDDRNAGRSKFTPLNLLDYIYAVLHNPAYRKRFAELLRIDFPRIPYPRDATHFRAVAAVGARLRELHLLYSLRLSFEKLKTTYNIPGDNIVAKVRFAEAQDGKSGRAYINAVQYFGEVPAAAWKMKIGGYRPAEKYLKDRKGRELNHKEIIRYRMIVAALAETAKICAPGGELEKTDARDR